MPKKTNKTILVAEDDPGIAELIKIILKEHGFKPVLCFRGDLVEASVKQHNPAIIFMDLWLPGIEGDKLTKKLKKSPETKHIAIIITSAQSRLAQISNKVKADAFLAKPFELSDLVLMANKYTA